MVVARPTNASKGTIQKSFHRATNPRCRGQSFDTAIVATAAPGAHAPANSPEVPADAEGVPHATDDSAVTFGS